MTRYRDDNVDPRQTCVPIATTATLILDGTNGLARRATIRNTGLYTVYLGGRDVAVSGAKKGKPVLAGAVVDAGEEDYWDEPDPLWGISVAASEVCVLEVRP